MSEYKWVKNKANKKCSMECMVPRVVNTNCRSETAKLLSFLEKYLNQKLDRSQY